MNAKLTCAVVALLVASAVATPAAAGNDAQPSLTVELAKDGSADVRLTLTYDLRSDAEREAFRTLETDADTRERVRKRFRDRMASVAASAANATGREMGVDDATIDVRTTPDNETGIVELAVTWTGLAAVEGDRLVVTEPFASGFETDRPVTLVAPDGYELAGATPDPNATGDGRATWMPGTDLDGFEATFGPASAGQTTRTGSDGTTAGEADGTTEAAMSGGTSGENASSSGGAPGFGVAVGLAALFGAALLASRR